MKNKNVLSTIGTPLLIIISLLLTKEGEAHTVDSIKTLPNSQNYEIRFPNDVIYDCGMIHGDTVEIYSTTCDMFSVSAVDDTILHYSNSCLFILRSHEVINWCEYDGVSLAETVYRDENCDGSIGVEDLWVLVRPNGKTYYDRDNDENNDNPPAGAKNSNCDGLTNPAGHWINSDIDIDALRNPVTGVVQTGPEPTPAIRDIASRGFWKYTQHVRVLDSIPPQVSIEPFEVFCSESNENCLGQIAFTFDLLEQCKVDESTVKAFIDTLGYYGVQGIENQVTETPLQGAFPHYNLTGFCPIGNHRLVIVATDLCGNNTKEVVNFTVADCQPPDLVCPSGITLDLITQPTGTDVDGDGDEDCAAVMVRVADFIMEPTLDCTGQIPPYPHWAPMESEVTRFSIQLADSPNNSELPDSNQTSLLFTCDDPDTINLIIYAWDRANNPYSVLPDGSIGGPNYASCEVFVIFNDTNDDCAGDECEGFLSGISGFIFTNANNPVSGVSVELSGHLTKETITDETGFYQFDSLETGYNYTITPSLNEDHKNGVSTFDIILITQHILGYQSLGNPYRIIAADANNSTNVTSLDLIQIRKLILDLEEAYPDNTSWRFVDRQYAFPEPLIPWSQDFPESIEVQNLAFPVSDKDFIATKIGDVNYSAETELLSDRIQIDK